MKTKLALAAALAVAWMAGPLTALAAEGGKEGPKAEARKDGKGGDSEPGRDGGGRDGGPGMRGPQQNPEIAKRLDKLREIEDRLRAAAMKARAGTDAEKAAAKIEARKVLGELFDAKLDLETAMLDQMEKRAAELKEKISRKKTARDEMIEARLARMTGEIDDW
jgi:Spy/CpxP family protein refolding chaperone